MGREPTFGQQLRAWRLKRDLSMGATARGMEISTVHYSDVENDRKGPFRAEKLNLLADVLGVPLADVQRAAAASRGSVNVDVTRATPAAREVMLSLARCAEDIDEETAIELQKIIDARVRSK